MIKRLLCWVFGHKDNSTQEVITFPNGNEVKSIVVRDCLTYKTSEICICKRCGVLFN